MKRESTEARQARRKRDAVRGILFFAMLQIITSVACASLCFIPGHAPVGPIILCLVLAILCLALIIPAPVCVKKTDSKKSKEEN